MLSWTYSFRALWHVNHFVWPHSWREIMSRKSASFFAGVFALSICSCTNNTDLTELKAELEAARKEAAEAKALAESVKAELAKDKDAIEATKLADAKARAAAEVAKIKLAKDMT